VIQAGLFVVAERNLLADHALLQRFGTTA